MRRLGCLGRMCSLPPLLTYPLSSICNPSSLKPFALFPHDTLHQQPWRVALVAWVGTLVVYGFLLPGGTRGPSDLCPGHCKGLSRFRFGARGSVHLQVSVNFYFFCRYDLCGHPFLLIRPRRPRNSLGWMSLECSSLPLMSNR